MLEVEVATDNAIHWQSNLTKANERNTKLNAKLCSAYDLLRRTNDLLIGARDQLRPRNHVIDRVMDDLSADIVKLLRLPDEP